MGEIHAQHRRWLEHWDTFNAVARTRDEYRGKSGGVSNPGLLAAFPPFPEDLRDMCCGAKTRAGTPCKRRDLYRNGRCRLHGGLSTGPRTELGKRRSSRNGYRPKKSRRRDPPRN